VSAATAFELPERLEAREPPEERGLARDEIRLLVSVRDTGRLVHARARDLPQYLAPGDLLVINTSATLPAALPATGPGGERVELHLSTPFPGAGGEEWVIELRRNGEPFLGGRRGDVLVLPAGARAELQTRYRGERLWVASLDLPEPLEPYLARHGHPIRYRYAPREWPLASYQTAYALEPGSAEMPSAGRALTPEVIAELVGRGIVVAPVVLHAGVSSLELHEPPFPERYSVPAPTARLVNATRAWGGRVIAVGTTVVRALETVAGADGAARTGEGWTDLVVTPDRGVRVVDGLLTGWHEPGSSHLGLLQAVGGRGLIARSYSVALRCGYLWHEFGDLHLILPGRRPLAAAGQSGKDSGRSRARS
jgi:S-adenosylmethionine:tRNA ribosyltransferase-isomerase